MSETRYRICGGPDCETMISNKLAFCRQHWFALSSEWRARVGVSLRENGTGAPAQIEVLNAAAEYLEERQYA